MKQAQGGNQAELSEICVRCGFCCSGVIYDQAPIDQDEVEFARSLGLDIAPMPGSDTGRHKFALPCPHLCGASCSIYRQPRPKVCSTFFCKLATNFSRGEVSQEQAFDRVEEAKRLMRAIEPLLLPNESWPMARARWSASRNTSPRDDRAAQFQLLMTALNLFLDRNFRKRRQRVIDVPDEMEGEPIGGD